MCEAKQVCDRKSVQIEPEEAAVAYNLHGIFSTIRAHHAGFCLSGEYAQRLSLRCCKLIGDGRYQRREVLIEQRRDIRMLVLRKQSTKRSRAHQRVASLVSMNGIAQESAARPHENVSVSERVGHIEGNTRIKRSNRVISSSFCLRLLDCDTLLVVPGGVFIDVRNQLLQRRLQTRSVVHFNDQFP